MIADTLSFFLPIEWESLNGRQIRTTGGISVIRQSGETAMQRLFLNNEVRDTVDNKSEKELQKFICDNWKKLFSEYTLIKDEFPLTGDVHGVGKKGRTDIFAYHNSKRRFTIFELKRDYNENVESQAANYAGFVRSKFADVYVEAKETHGAPIPEKAKLDDKEIEIVLIARAFSGIQIQQAGLSKYPITLIEYRWFADDILLLDYVHNAPDIKDKANPVKQEWHDIVQSIGSKELREELLAVSYTKDNVKKLKKIIEQVPKPATRNTSLTAKLADLLELLDELVNGK